MPRIFAVTNRRSTGDRPFLSFIKEVVLAGVDAIILREKDLAPADLYRLACSVQKICDGTETRLLINTSIEVALAAGADGVHLGAGSLPPDAARRIMPGGIIGVSVHSPAEAVKAAAKGADYILAGHVFPTRSKPGQDGRGPGFITQIAELVTIPVIGIGASTPGMPVR